MRAPWEHTKTKTGIQREILRKYREITFQFLYRNVFEQNCNAVAGQGQMTRMAMIKDGLF